MLGRDPRLRQPALGEQFAQPPSVLAIGLGAALATTQRARLHRLGQMRHRAGPNERIAHEQPARASLDGDIDLASIEASDPPCDRRRRGINPTAAHLTRVGVERIEGDLRSMYV